MTDSASSSTYFRVFSNENSLFRGKFHSLFFLFLLRPKRTPADFLPRFCQIFHISPLVYFILGSLKVIIHNFSINFSGFISLFFPLKYCPNFIGSSLIVVLILEHCPYLFILWCSIRLSKSSLIAFIIL